MKESEIKKLQEKIENLDNVYSVKIKGNRMYINLDFEIKKRINYMFIELDNEELVEDWTRKHCYSSEEQYIINTINSILESPEEDLEEIKEVANNEKKEFEKKQKMSRIMRKAWDWFKMIKNGSYGIERIVPELMKKEVVTFSDCLKEAWAYFA